jgi:hypothetical protein
VGSRTVGGTRSSGTKSMFLWRWGEWYYEMGWMDKMCIRFSLNQCDLAWMDGVVWRLQHKVADMAHGFLIRWNSFNYFRACQVWAGLGEPALWRRIWIGVLEKSKAGISLRSLPSHLSYSKPCTICIEPDTSHWHSNLLLGIS